MRRRVMTYRHYMAEDAKIIADCPDGRGVEDGEGFFVQYGFECCEGGTYSTAIVEMTDGNVKNIVVGMIKFLDPSPEEIRINDLNMQIDDMFSDD